jgi:autotransporter-associated beta strand protein
MKIRHPHLRLFLLALGLPTAAMAVDKANNATNLDQSASWVGGLAPGPGQLAAWTSTVTAANTVVLGSDASWAGVQVVGPGGLVTVGAGNTLTLGASGINLSTATQNLTLNCGLTLSAPQAWTVASGRVLTVGGVFSNGGNSLTVTGNAATGTDVAAVIANGAFSGDGNLTKAGLGVMALGATGSGVNFSMNAGSVIQVDGGTLRNETGATNSWTGNLSSLKVAAGATFDLGDTDTVVDTLSGVGAGFGTIQKNGPGTKTLTIGANHGGGTFSGVIKQLGGVFILGKTGSGTTTLSGSTDNNKLLAAVTSGTLVLDKAGSGAGSLAAGVRAVYGITDIAPGATLKLAGTGSEQIYGFGPVSSGVAGTGTVVMSGGTLDFNGRNEGWDGLSGSGIITNSGAVASQMTLGEDGGSGSFAGTISNGTSAMSVRKTGFGTQTLSGTNTYTGATALTRGTLLVTGSLPNSTLTVTGAANSTLGGEGSVLAVVLNNANKLSVDPSTPGALSTGALTVNVPLTAKISVVLAGGGFSPGVPFKVINYTSNANSWSTANFVLANATNYRSPVFSDTPNVAVSLSIGASNIAWNNASGDSKWNLGGSINFAGGEKFYTFDTVTFGDVPAGNQIIAVDGALQPTAWNINSSLNYTFNNGTAGSITGSTGLVKAGTGTATLNLTNTFTGATTVNGGRLAIGSDAALGTPPAIATPARITLDGGTLGLTSAFALSPNRGIAIGAAGAGLDTSAAGNGSLVEIASEITGAGNLSITANGDTSDAPAGVGALWLSNNSNGFTGEVTVTSGLVSMASKFGATSNSVVLNGGGLVAQGANPIIGNNILVGALGGRLRTAATAAISGAIANAPGVTNALLRHTEGGILTLAGSGAGFTGTYANLRGATVVSATNANWAQTAFVLDPNGSTLTFNGGGTATVKSISSTRNVQLNDGTTLDVPSITMATNSHAFLTTLGSPGALTSSTGTLTVTNGATTGTMGTLDHQLQVEVTDFDGFTPLALVKNNTNSLVLGQPNTYSGGTTINMGRLQATNALALGSGPVTVNNGGQVYLSSGGVIYPTSVTLNGLGQPEAAGTLGALRLESNSLAGSLVVASPSRVTAYTAGTVANLTGMLLGAANLETTGSGTINLAGDASGYTGTLTAGQGTLNLNSPVFGGSLSVADGTTLSGEGAIVGNLTLGTAATTNLLFNPSTPGALEVSGAVAINGTVVVGLSGAIPAGGTYKVLGFGSKSGGWTAANFSAGTSFRPGTVFTVNANDVSITITKASLTWNNAAGNSIWDTSISANFRDSVPNNQRFYWGDDVSFTDLPAAAQTITINGAQQPSSVTVSSQFAYTFNAGTAGVIAGGASLLKAGTGTLTVNLANTFAGGTTISEGTLVHGNAAATGSITSGPITLGDANSSGANQEIVFTAGVQNLNNATAYKPVIVTADGNNAALTFNQGAAFANLTLDTARPILLRTTGTGTQSGMMGAVSGAAAGAGNESITFSAPAGASFYYTTGYSGSGVVPNTFAGDVRLTGGGNIFLQNLGYLNSAYENGIVPDASSVTVTSGTTWTLNWGDETIDALDGGGNMVNTANSTNTLTLGAGNGSGTFTGVMSGAGGVVKTGTGTQELIGANTYTGPNEIIGGTLVLSTRTAAYGSTTVADGATLAITGSGGSKWSTSTLALGLTTGATLTIGNFASGINPCVEASGSLAAFGVVKVNVSGIFSGGTYPLIRYPAAGIEGNGFGAFVLGSLPAGITATLEDDGVGTIFLNVTDAGQLTWTGATSANWDTTTPNWKLGAAAAAFTDGDNVLFSDAVTPGRAAVVLNTTVSPSGVTFSNGIATPYSLAGTGTITGSGTLIKNGLGKLTLTNANTFTGGTSVAGGELQFGDGTTDGSVAGNITNASTVSFNNAAPQTFAGVISGTGALAKKGVGTLILTGANTFSGATTINQGTLQLGNGTSNGSLGTGTVSVPAGTRLYLNYATATPGGTGIWSSFVTGAGTLELQSAQGANGGANWGPNTAGSNPFNPAFTGTLLIDNGRVDSSPAGMGGISKMVIKNGAQFLAWSGTYTTPVEIAGNGWGEAGYPSALRVAASSQATWTGSITLTANAGIYSQDGNSVFTLTGPITGPYECDFIRNGPIVVQPAVAVQNSYGSTKISNNGGTGVVLAGNPYAFSTGGLVMNGGVLALNDFNFTFANLSGTTGSIINNSATAAVAVITVGTDGTSTSCAATLSDGNTGKLGLTKVGAGSLTLTAANTNTGPTTVNGGVLLVNGSLSASSAVAVATTGTLGGSGSVTGAITAGGTLAPGSAAATGTLTLGPTALTGTYACHLNGAACDVLAVNGNLTLTGATLAVSPLAGGATQNSYVIATYTGTRNGTFATVTGLPVGYGVDYNTANQIKLVVGTTGYAAWAASYGLTGANALANADPDKDGVANAVEFVLGGNPATVMNAALLPTIALVTNPGGTVPNGSYLKFTYRRTPASAYLNPGIEYDADLTGAWTSAAGAPQVVTPGFYTTPTPADKVEVYVSRTANQVNGKLFGRLRVTNP